MSHTLIRSLRCFIQAFALLFVLGSPTPLIAAVGDDYLIVLPSREIPGLTETETAKIRIYQRFGEYSVVGVPADILPRLIGDRRGGMIIDDEPWSSSYAVVSAHPGRSSVDLSPPMGVTVLFVSDGLILLKGTAGEFQELRSKGFDCAEMTGEPLPPAPPVLRAPLLTASPTDTILSIISLVSDSSVEASIQDLQNFGTRVWSRPNRDTVFSWVRHCYLELEIADVQLDSFQYSGTWQKNVVATIPGTLFPDREIIVGGHLDSQNFSFPDNAPGADDNATGTTAALEMARVLTSIGYQPAYTLRFMGFAAEEAGLIGSNHYASLAHQRGDDIRVMMNYDMLGYRNQGMADRDFDIVWYAGSEAYSDLHAATASMYTTLTPVMSSSYRSSSDSWSFYQQGYHTLFCIENDFNPYYHTQNDLLQYLDIPYAADIIRSGLAMLLILDQLPATVPALEVLDRGDGSSLFVQWEASEDPDVVGYNVYVGTAPGIYDTVYYQTSVSRVLSGLTTGMMCYVGVSAVDLIGTEGMILEAHETPLMVPRPPAGLSAESGPEGIMLTWDPNSELDLGGYNIYRAPDSNAAFIQMNAGPIPDPAWTDTSMTPVVYYYYVSAVDTSGNESEPSDTVHASPTVGVPDVANGLPETFRLFQNYPNPFNPATTIVYDVPVRGHVEIRVVDILGREVVRLVDEERMPGRYATVWNTGSAASGVYYFQLQAGAFHETMKGLLIK